jgi:hypothetical protein
MTTVSARGVVSAENYKGAAVKYQSPCIRLIIRDTHLARCNCTLGDGAGSPELLAIRTSNGFSQMFP